MKKLLISLLLLYAVLGITKVQAESFEEVISQDKPSAVLIYADWADNLNDVKNAYGTLKSQYSTKYNFLGINISKEEAKSFNKNNYVYPNLPYLLLYKDRGKMSRCVPKECILDNACVKDKMDIFAN